MLEKLIQKKDFIESIGDLRVPVVLYGMGDGAAKILHLFKNRGITCSGIFASDNFVRGQSFMGFKVETLSQIQNRLGDFTVVVAFASALPEVIDRVKDLSLKRRVFIPEINVAGDPLELFDRRYLTENIKALEELRGGLYDESSVAFFDKLTEYKYTADPCYLWDLDSKNVIDMLNGRNIITYCDLGAYDGDTVELVRSRHPELENVIAFEPSVRSYSKLEARMKMMGLKSFLALNCAAGSHDELTEISDGGRGASVENNHTVAGIKPKKLKKISQKTLDSATNNGAVHVDLIKYDVEGFEAEALKGSENTISCCRPDIVMSVYHRRDDLLDLYSQLKKRCPGGRFFLSKSKKSFPAWDVRLTVIQ